MLENDGDVLKLTARRCYVTRSNVLHSISVADMPLVVPRKQHGCISLVFVCTTWECREMGLGNTKNNGVCSSLRMNRKHTSNCCSCIGWFRSFANPVCLDCLRDGGGGVGGYPRSSWQFLRRWSHHILLDLLLVDLQGARVNAECFALLHYPRVFVR